MTLITRMARLFKADFHRVLDHIEEPEALLRHAIREMQDSLDKAEINLDSSQQRDQELTGRLGELEQSLDDIDTQLDLCFESNKDELARGPVKRKLEANALKKRLAAQQSILRQSITQQQEALVQNQLRLEHLRQKADTFTTRQSHYRDDNGSIDSILAGIGGIAVDDTDVDVAILREKKLRNTP
jgi:phage shock protein A